MASIAQPDTMSFERGVFLALLLILLLLVVRLILNWPPAVEVEDARIDYREPERVPAASATLPDNAFAGRDLLVPMEFARSWTEALVTAPRPQNPAPAVNRPVINRSTGDIALKPKTAPKPVVTAKQPEAPAAPEEKKLPLSIKGVINFSGLGYRLLVVDQDEEYRRMQVDDTFDYLGETYTIRKITADSAVFADSEGRLITLKNDFDFAKAVDALGSGGSAPRPAAPRPAPAPAASKPSAPARGAQGGGNRTGGAGRNGGANRGGGASRGGSGFGGGSAGQLEKLAKQFGGANAGNLLKQAQSGRIDPAKLMQEAKKRGISDSDIQNVIRQFKK